MIWSDIGFANSLTIPTLPTITNFPHGLNPLPLDSYLYPLPLKPTPRYYHNYLMHPPPTLLVLHTPPSVTATSGRPPLLPNQKGDAVERRLSVQSAPLHLLSILTIEQTYPRLPYCLGRDLERDVGYGIIDTWEEMLVDMPGAPATDDTELGRRMTEFATRVRQDTNEIYVRLDDEQTERQLMAGRLNMLYRDRRAHARTTLLMEREARMSQEAWG
ncbi:hypothetical protein Tco_0969919 [Tanacetum coccineum]